MEARFKRIFSLFIILCLLYTGTSAVFAKGSDISGHRAEGEINKWVSEGLIKGYPDGRFKPDSPIIRAEFITFINRIFNFTDKSGKAFTDVKSNDWFAEDIAKISAAGALMGDGYGKARPNDKLTRQEAAVILSRVLYMPARNKNAADKFKDSNKIALWSRNAVSSMTERGYISAKSDNSFDPLGEITRAEAVKMLNKAIGELKYKADTYSGDIKGNLSISTGSVILKSMTIDGDLYLLPGIGDGKVTLDGVIVKGKTVLYGDKRNIELKNSKLADTIAISGSIPSDITVYNLKNGGYESDITDWGSYTDKADAPSAIPDAVQGEKSLKLRNDEGGFTAAWQEIPFGDTDASPRVGDRVQLGAWVKLGEDADTSGPFAIQLESIAADGSKTLLISTPSLEGKAKGSWFYISSNIEQIPEGSTSTVVSYQDSMTGTVEIDDLKVINVSPRRDGRTASGENAGTGEVREYIIKNPGFDDNITSESDLGWGIWPTPLIGVDAAKPWNNNGVGLVMSPVHDGARAIGMSNGAAIWQVIKPGSNGPQDGDIAEAEAWVYVYPGSKGTFLLVEALDKDNNKTEIAKSRMTDENDSGWVLLKTKPKGPGKVPAGSSLGIVVSVQNGDGGQVVIDSFSTRSIGNNGKGGTDVNMGKTGSDAPYKHLSEYALQNNSFEDSDLEKTNWGVYGNVAVSDADGYYGSKSAKFFIDGNSTPNTAIWQTINIGSGADDPKPEQKVEAGAWVFFSGNSDFTGHNLYVEVNAIDADGNKTSLAKSNDIGASTPKGQWVYLKTQPVGDGKIPSNAASVVVSIENDVVGTVYADFIQIGQAGAVNGNPGRFAMFAYQPWYGNESDWENWKWSDGPEGFNHNPDTILPDGRRDVAAAYYPLVGAYDSLDDNLLEYQFDIAKAALVDGFMVNDYGKDISQRYRQVINKMFNIAEKKGMKMAFQYDCKINLVGWVPATENGSRQEKIDGLTADLKYILDHYSSRKAFLKYNGIPVISIFGVYLLDESEWDYVYQTLNDQGYRFILMGDGLSGRTDMAGYYKAFGSMYNWHLNDESLRPSSKPTYDTAYTFAAANDKIVRKWVSAVPENRFGVGMIWPGFDDTGVGSWGSGAPRLTDYIDGALFDASAQSVLDSGVNWVLLATMNDWNESTSLEPSKEKGYFYMIRTQNFLEKFKGAQDVDDNLIQKITEDYLTKPDAVKFK